MKYLRNPDRRIIILVAVCLMLAAIAVGHSRSAAEGTEYLPTFFGLKFKITDVLIVVLTAALAIYTRELNRSTLKLWSSGEKQIEAARASADAAAASARIARDTLILTNRAWLQGAIVKGDQPLSYANGGLHFMVGFDLENIGNAPALKISFRAWLIGLELDRAITPEQKHKDLCDIARREEALFNYCLFPGQKFPEAAGYNSMMVQAVMGADEFQRCVIRNQPFGDALKLYVGGAVNYCFASDPGAVHQTTFLYELEKASLPRVIVIAHGDIPGRDLYLGPMPLGDGRGAD